MTVIPDHAHARFSKAKLPGIGVHQHTGGVKSGEPIFPLYLNGIFLLDSNDFWDTHTPSIWFYSFQDNAFGLGHRIVFNVILLQH
jgi:hypothetical protein